MGVGVAAIVTNHEQHPGCVLLGKRVGSDGSGTWALPGGHLEFGESFEACAAREVEEETGCKTRAAALLCVDNAIDAAASYHYVVPFVVCRTRDEPENKEPTKCEGWRWQRWDDPDFPAPLFTALANVRRRGLEVPFAASGEDEAAPPADEARGWRSTVLGTGVGITSKRGHGTSTHRRGTPETKVVGGAEPAEAPHRADFALRARQR